MKVIFDFQDMSGGAPNSQLAHMMLMHEMGHDVIAVIGKDQEKLSKKTALIKIFKIRNYNLKNPIGLIKSILDWLEILKIQNPNIIHSNRPVQNRMLAVVSKICVTPFVFAQAGGRVKYADILPLLGNVAIVYSKENQAALLEIGFKSDDIHLISNRIPACKYTNFEEKSGKKDGVIITLAGNIKTETINGIRFYLDLIGKQRKSIEGKVTFYIVGADISDGKIFEQDIRENIEKINKELGKDSQVQYLGWISNINAIQSESDICIGKGRSILQPAMMGKICYVISENGTLTRIKESTFDQLFFFNFSGRGNQEDNTGEFISLLKNRELINSLQNEAYEVQELINNNYNISLAYDKLIAAYESAIEKAKTNQKRKRNWLAGLCLFFKIYYAKYKYKNYSVKIKSSEGLY